MLDGLRAFARTWIAKVLFAVLIVSFAAFGINGVIADLGASTVAKLGDEDITVREFQREYSSQVGNLSQQLGMSITPDQAVSFGVPSQTLNTLAYLASIERLSSFMNLGVSESRLGKMLRESGVFVDLLGNFDRDVFTDTLKSNDISEAEYFESQARAAHRQQLELGLFKDAAVPKAAQDLINRYSTDTRTLDYFVINGTNVPTIADPTDADLAAYLAENQADFRTTETRTVDVFDLSVEALAATKTITDEEIAAEYEKTKASRVRIEKRQIQQLPFPSDDVAATFEAGKAAGKSFETLLAESGLTATDLGSVEKSTITDAALADAAFGLAVGDFVIIPGATGKRAVYVSDIVSGGQISLEEAREDVRTSLAMKLARDEYVDILDQVEELRAAFQPLTQIAQRYTLPVVSLSTTATGAELVPVSGIAEADRQRVADAIFAAEEAKLTPTVPLSGNHNVFFDLKSIEPARDQTLDEVRDQVVAAWTEQKTNEAITALVETVKAQLASGTSIADAAVALNAFPQISPPIDRSGDGTPIIDDGVAGTAFSGGEGHFGAALNGDGDYVIFKVAEVTPSADPVSPDTMAMVETASRNDLFAEFVTGLRDEAGLRINQQVLQQLIGLTGATTGQ